MPYIALQLVGMEVVIAGLGINMTLDDSAASARCPTCRCSSPSWCSPLYTYTSGLRAPALIAVVKDALLYVTVIAAVIVIPAELGGFAKIFASGRSEDAAAGAGDRGQSRTAIGLCDAGARFDAWRCFSIRMR